MTPKHPEQHLNRRKTIFYTALGLIVLLLVVSLAAVLTNRFRPTASEISPSDATRIANDLVIRDGKLQYDDGAGKNGSVGVNEVVLERLSSQLAFTFALQAREDLSRAPEWGGVLTVKTANGSSTISSDWTSIPAQTLADKTQRQVVLNNPVFKTAVLSMSGPLVVTLKADYYVSKTVTVASASALFGQVTSFGSLLAGDLNNDDVVNISDLAIINARLNTDTAADTIQFDMNGNGRIDGDDLAIMRPNLNLDED
jgi:dockerin type I repeat protein